VGASLPAQARADFLAALPALLQAAQAGAAAEIQPWDRYLVKVNPLWDTHEQRVGSVLMRVSRATAEAVVVKLQRFFGGCDTKAHEERLCERYQRHTLVVCHQSPTKTCDRGNPTVCSSGDHVASPLRWCVMRAHTRPTASSKAVGGEGGSIWRPHVHRCYTS